MSDNTPEQPLSLLTESERYQMLAAQEACEALARLLFSLPRRVYTHVERKGLRQLDEVIGFMDGRLDEHPTVAMDVVYWPADMNTSAHYTVTERSVSIKSDYHQTYKVWVSRIGSHADLTCRCGHDDPDGRRCAHVRRVSNTY